MSTKKDINALFTSGFETRRSLNVFFKNSYKIKQDISFFNFIASFEDIYSSSIL